MASVEFKRTILVERAVRPARRGDGKLTMLQSEFEVGGRTQVDSYGVAPGPKKDSDKYWSAVSYW
jgi:hypothetical protein